MATLQCKKRLCDYNAKQMHLNSLPIKALTTLLIILSGLFSMPVFGQENQLSKEKVEELLLLQKRIEGTYQIQMIATRSLPAIHLTLMERIDNNRLESEVAYFYYKPNIRVKVLPKNIISQHDFLPIERLIHISSTDL